MGISLNGLTPANTYQSLIKVGDNSQLTETLKTLSDGFGTDLPMQVSTSGVNFTGTLTQNGQPITTSPSGGAGAIQFSDGSAFASDSNLFWDNTNKRLGVGTNTPSTALEVKTANTGDVDFVNFTNGNGINTARFKANGGLVLGLSSDFSLLPGAATLTRFGASFGFLSAPSARVHVKGSGSTSATTSLLVQNSSGTELLKVNDAGDLSFSTLETSPKQIHTPGNANKGITIDNEVTLGAFFGITFKAWDNSSYSTFMRITGNTSSRGLILGGTTNDPSAILQADSTTQGFLPPRMTTTQKNAISTPAAGLQVYDTDLNQMSYYNGTSWVNF